MTKLGFRLLALALAIGATPVMAQTAAPNSTAAPGVARTSPAVPAPGVVPSVKTAPAEKLPLLDINSATKDELDRLPGIGAARAEAIIKGRPYKGKDDLRRRKVIPSNAYEGIKDRIVARQS